MWGTPKWVKTIVPIRDRLAHARSRFAEISEQYATVANSEWHHAAGCECDRAMQAWQLTIVGTCLGAKQYVPKRDQDDYWLAISLAVAGEESAMPALSELCQKYGQKPTSAGAIDALLKDLCVSKDTSPSCHADVRTVSSILELWINREVCRCFGDKASADRIGVTTVGPTRQVTSQRPLDIF